MRTIIIIGYPDFGPNDPKLVYLGSDGEAATTAAAAIEPGTFKRLIKVVNPMGIPIPLDGSTHARILNEARDRAERDEKQAVEDRRTRKVKEAEKRFQQAHEDATGLKATATGPVQPADEFEEELAEKLKGLPTNARIQAEADARAERFAQLEAGRKAGQKVAEAEKRLEEAHTELHQARPGPTAAAPQVSKDAAGETPAAATETVALPPSKKKK